MLQPLDETIDENGDLVDAQGAKVVNKFSIEKYQKNEDKIHPMSAFERDDIKNYIDSAENILENQRSSKTPTFMRVDPEDDVSPNQKVKIMEKVNTSPAPKRLDQGDQMRINALNEGYMVEGILALYKINAMGGMQKHSQVDLNMGRKFFHSQNGNM